MSPTDRGHIIAAILFTDIVGSTGLAAELGDETWKRLLHKHHGIVGRLVKSHDGRVIDTAGDGVLAIFHRPAAAIACAFDAIGALRAIGLDIRAGIHFGETESAGGKVSGIVVHTASRVMALAGPGEVLITATVRDLVAGKRIAVEDRGRHDLKGIPDSWNVFAVEEVEGRRIPPPMDPGDADALRARAVHGETVARSRRMLAAAVALLVLIASIVLLTVGDSERGAATNAETSLVRIDLETGERTELSVGKTVTGAAVGDGSVWLASFGDSSVYRIHPTTMAVQRRISLPEPPQELGFGAGSLWATTSRNLLRIDPTSGSIEQEFRIGSCAEIAEECTTDVVVSDEVVWAMHSDRRRLIEIDPTRESVTQRVRLRSYPIAMASGHGGLWVLMVSPLTVQRIDLETDAIDQEALPGAIEPVCYSVGDDAYYAGQECAAIGVAGQGVWVATPGDLSSSQLWQLDPANGDLRGEPVELPCCVMAIAPTTELVSKLWTGSSDGELFVVTEVSRRSDHQGTVGAIVTDLAIDDDQVWVTVDPQGLKAD